MSEPILFQLADALQRDSNFVADWPLCQLRVMNDQQYPWFVMIPRRSAVTELIDLTEQDYWQCLQEIRAFSGWLQQQFQPDKLNIAALGNMVPQLHIHQIARFRTDLAWPAPIWGKVPMQPYPEVKLQQLIELWQPSLVARMPSPSSNGV